MDGKREGFQEVEGGLFGAEVLSKPKTKEWPFPLVIWRYLNILEGSDAVRRISAYEMNSEKKSRDVMRKAIHLVSCAVKKQEKWAAAR